jgi:hypothetical protein
MVAVLAVVAEVAVGCRRHAWLQMKLGSDSVLRRDTIGLLFVILLAVSETSYMYLQCA